MCAAGIVSGKEIMSLLLLRQLKAQGNFVFCAVSSWGSLDYRERLLKEGIGFEILRKGFISKTLSWSAIRMTMVQLFYLPALWIKYVILVQRVKPDVVIHTNFHHVFLLWPLLDKTKSWYWSHEVTGYTRFYRKLFGLLETRLLGFICVSEAVAASLRRLDLSRKIIVINNGIELPHHVPDVDLKKNWTVFGIVGQVSPHKGLEVLIEALAQLPTDSWKLKIFGKGLPEYETALKQKIEDLGCSSGCEWMGFVRDVDLIYREFEVLVVPSIFPDPFPTTIMEAGVRGIPVIGSASGGIPEMIEEGKNGFLFKTKSVFELRLLLERVSKIKGDKEWKATCREYAQQRFGLESFTRKMITTIKPFHD